MDKDLFETVEEVFDRATLLAVLDLVRKGFLYELKGVVSAGKEARVYWGKGRGGEDLAVKIYLTSTAEFRKGIIKYIRGDPRFEGYVPKSSKKLMALWARKEFKNYALLLKAGVSVPKPIAHHKNVLIMEFIGDSGMRAPLLKEVSLGYEDAHRVFNAIIEDVKKAFLKAKLVHGDLSEYNVMLWRGKHYIIDVGQAVKIDHPHALDFLLRDLRNVIRFFKEEVGLEVPDPQTLFKDIAASGSP